MKEGIKHLIECRCSLTTFKKRSNPPLHKFVVFSILENDEVIPKFSQCNNCGIVHKVIGLCKSEIVSGKEDLKSEITIDEIKLGIPESVIKILENANVDRATFEAVAFYIQNEKIGSFILLNKEEVDKKTHGKILKYDGNNKFSIEPFMY